MVQLGASAMSAMGLQWILRLGLLKKPGSTAQSRNTRAVVLGLVVAQMADAARGPDEQLWLC